MPLMLELKYEYFPATWPGRIKLTEIGLALLCLMCSAPAFTDTQHWFLLVVTVCLIGTIFFCLYHLCLTEPLNKLIENWLTIEFWFTALATFLYFTAFIAQLAEFTAVEYDEADCEEDCDLPQYWVDAQIAAGVFALFNNIVYAVGAYFIYADWKAPAAPVPAV